MFGLNFFFKKSMSYSKPYLLRLDRVSEPLYRELHKKNFGYEGMMQGTLERHYEGHWRDPKDAWVFIVSEEKTNTVAAWSLVYNDYGIMRAYFFTCPEHRRKGLGTQLAIKVERFIRLKKSQFYYEPHDPPSHSFFGKLRDKNLIPNGIER